MSEFKPALADALIECLSPIRQRFEELQQDPEYVKSIMIEGAEITQEEASKRMEMIKTIVGLLGWSVF